MTDSITNKTLLLFEENLQRIVGMPPTDPGPRTKFWRQSAHRTLGHLAACQAAWLPYMRWMREGKTEGSISIRPDPLFTKLGFAKEPWEGLVQRFVADRAEWRKLMKEVDPSHELTTPAKVLTAQRLTKRMVDHEKGHLDGLQRELAAKL